MGPRPSGAGAVAVLSPLLLLVGLGVDSIAEAERLATEAVRLVAERPEAALAQARHALELTQEFEPTAFVKAGRRGEVVEDAYLEARRDYRRHRARLYQALGDCLARSGRQREGARYLRRAFDLDPGGGSGLPLARALVALARGQEALDVILAGAGTGLGPEALAVAGEAADALGLPSLQAEVDRARIERLSLRPRLEYREGPLRLPERTRLSTGAPLRLDGDGPTFLYLAEADCRSCSRDLTSLAKIVPAGVATVAVPMSPDEDQGLRRTLALYGLRFPVLLGHGSGSALGIEAPAVLVVARRGWAGAIVRPPFPESLPPAVEVFSRAEVREDLPRPAWNHRPPGRKPPAPRPGLLPDGLAPGEDEPAPEEFARAVEAFEGGRAREALRLFEALERKDDGWLLPAEGRLDRALCLAALGRREEARALLLRTGDSRFQDAVDRALESVGSPPKKR